MSNGNDNDQFVPSKVLDKMSDKAKKDWELEGKLENRRLALRQMTESFTLAGVKVGCFIVKTDIQRGLNLATYALKIIDAQVAKEVVFSRRLTDNRFKSR